MLYTMWAVLGLMMLDFVIGIIRSLVTKSFTLNSILEYLQNFLYHVFPLLVIITVMPLDPTQWVLLIFYYISGLALVLHYLINIVNKWRA